MDYSDTDMMKYVTRALDNEEFRRRLKQPDPNVVAALSGTPLTDRQLEMLQKLTEEDWKRLKAMRDELAPTCFCNMA